MTIARPTPPRLDLFALTALLAACGAEASSDFGATDPDRSGGAGDRLGAASGNTPEARAQLIEVNVNERFWASPEGLDARRGGPAARPDPATLSPTEKYDLVAYGLDPAPLHDPRHVPFDGNDCGAWTQAYYDAIGPVTRTVHQVAGHWRMVNGVDDDADGIEDRAECGADQDFDGLRADLDHAWASAVLTYEEPGAAVTQAGTTFSAEEQKALLIADQVFPQARYSAGPCAGQPIPADGATGRLEPQDDCLLGPHGLHVFFAAFGPDSPPFAMRVGPAAEARHVLVSRFEVESARAITIKEAAELAGASDPTDPSNPSDPSEPVIDAPAPAPGGAYGYAPRSEEARGALALINTADHELLSIVGLPESLIRAVQDARWGRRGFTSDDFVLGSLSVIAAIPGMTEQHLRTIIEYALAHGYQDYEDWEARPGYWENAESNPGLVYSDFRYYGYILGSEESTAALNFVNNELPWLWHRDLDLGGPIVNAIFERLERSGENPTHVRHITNLCELATVRGMTRSSFETIVRYAMDENYANKPVSRAWAAGLTSDCVPPEPPSRVIYGVGEGSEEARAILALANTLDHEYYTEVVGMSEDAARAMVEVRQRAGGIGSICELVSVPGVTELQLLKLAYAGVSGNWNFYNDRFWEDAARAASCTFDPPTDTPPTDTPPIGTPAPSPRPAPAPSIDGEFDVPGNTEHIIHARARLSSRGFDNTASEIELHYLLFLDADEVVIGGHYLRGPDAPPALLWESAGPSRNVAGLDRRHLTSWFQ